MCCTNVLVFNMNLNNLKSTDVVTEDQDSKEQVSKKIRIESDKCDEDNCKKDEKSDEKCEYSYYKFGCKCVEEFIRKEREKNTETILLPSLVREKEEIFFPEDISNEDPAIYGKWLIFTNGDINLQNHLWLQLQNFVKTKDLVLIGSSTAKKVKDRDDFQGVVKCYTSKDINVIRRAGIFIQKLLRDDTILDYKTNEASKNNLFRANGNRFITKFMLTISGKMYKRDKLSRWIKITDAEYENFAFDEEFSENISPFPERKQSGLYLLPSRETRKKMKRYVYPEGDQLYDRCGVWCLFCNITDADANGLTELDRVWNAAKTLTDEGNFKSVTCETYAFKHHSNTNIPRRTVMCETKSSDSVDEVVKLGDKLRDKALYNMPMYYKIFCYNVRKPPNLHLRYLYMEDRELYQHSEFKWQLLKRA